MLPTTNGKSLCEYFVRRVKKLIKSSGLKWTYQYLKECDRLLRMKLAGVPQVLVPGNPLVGLRKSGVPKVFPKFVDSWFDLNSRNYVGIRLVLTLLGVVRVWKLPGKLKLDTITSPYTGSVTGFSDKVLWDAIYRLWGMSSRLVLNQWAFKPIWTAGPNVGVSFHGMIIDAVAFILQPKMLLNFARYGLKQTGGVILFLFLLSNLAIALVLIVLDWTFAFGCLGTEDLKLGRLAIKHEAGGKERVFAITDWWTQTILRPLHESLFKLLKRLPMDGTFDQNRSVEYGRMLSASGREAFAFDLSAATDRLPMFLQVSILSLMIGEGLAKAWGSLLVDRDWVFKGKPLRYAVGQPMGALSSWAMLAVTHHVIVQIAALQSGHTSLFKDYIILGDDVVIFDQVVAQSYLSLMGSLGVDINLSKSVISPYGWFEFAKRFTSGHVDVTPLGVKSLVLGIRQWQALLAVFLDSLQKGVSWSPSSVSACLDRLIESSLIRRRSQANTLFLAMCGPGGAFGSTVWWTAFADSQAYKYLPSEFHLEGWYQAVSAWYTDEWHKVRGTVLSDYGKLGVDNILPSFSRKTSVIADACNYVLACYSPSLWYVKWAEMMNLFPFASPRQLVDTGLFDIPYFGEGLGWIESANAVLSLPDPVDLLLSTGPDTRNVSDVTKLIGTPQETILDAFNNWCNLEHSRINDTAVVVYDHNQGYLKHILGSNH